MSTCRDFYSAGLLKSYQATSYPCFNRLWVSDSGLMLTPNDQPWELPHQMYFIFTLEYFFPTVLLMRNSSFILKTYLNFSIKMKITLSIGCAMLQRVTSNVMIRAAVWEMIWVGILALPHSIWQLTHCLTSLGFAFIFFLKWGK